MEGGCRSNETLKSLSERTIQHDHGVADQPYWRHGTTVSLCFVLSTNSDDPKSVIVDSNVALMKDNTHPSAARSLMMPLLRDPSKVITWFKAQELTALS